MDFYEVKEYAKGIVFEPRGDRDWGHYLVAAGTTLEDGTKVFANNQTDRFENDIGGCAERQVIAKVIDMGVDPSRIGRIAVWAKDRGYEEINLSCCDECQAALRKYCPDAEVEIRYENEVQVVPVSRIKVKKNWFVKIYGGADKIEGYEGPMSSHNGYLDFQKLSPKRQEAFLKKEYPKFNKLVKDAMAETKKRPSSPSMRR